MNITIYLYLKAFHIVGFVSWFVGLFYLLRLFIYYVEAAEKPAQEKKILQDQLGVMAERLYRIITTPAMYVTFFCGFGMIFLNPAIFTTWLQIKLLLVFLLVGYHYYCGHLMKCLLAGETPFSSYRLRILNEVPTLFLVTIVLLAVFKNTLDFAIALLILVALIIFLILGIRFYKKVRERAS